jgi:hypothetical protein
VNAYAQLLAWAEAQRSSGAELAIYGADPDEAVEIIRALRAARLDYEAVKLAREQRALISGLQVVVVHPRFALAPPLNTLRDRQEERRRAGPHSFWRNAGADYGPSWDI